MPGLKMKGEVVLPQKLSDSGFSLDTHIFRYRRDSDVKKNEGGVAVVVSSIIDEIDNSSIWHSAVGALNDPFEIYAKVNTHEFNQMTENQRINIWLKLMVKSGHAGIMVRSSVDMLKHYKLDEFRLRKTFLDMNENSKTFQELVSDIRESVGVACFTSVCDSRLMWGYYCNGLSGVCLIYNARKLKENKLDLDEVDYHPGAYEVNIIDFVYNCNEKQQTNTLAKIARTKHSDWSHENESRSIIDLHGGQRDKGRLETLKVRCIEGVIVGRGVRKDVRDKIIILSKKYGFKLFSADVDYQIFGVRIS